MRIKIRWALATLVPALVCSSGIARAESLYKFVSSAPTPATEDSYYSQNSEQQYLTGADEPKSAAPVEQGMGNCNWSDTCCDCIGDWRDNTVVWFGADAYKSLGDSLAPVLNGSWMNSAGVVGGFNTGFALGNSRVRGQLGASYGIYDFKGRDSASFSSSEQQTFVTVGVFKRSDICNCDRISWGGVYDQFFAHQWGLLAGEVYLSQLRGIFGYALSECNEVGIWGTAHTNNDNSVTGFNSLRAENQFNFYWRHNYDFGAQTMAYIGGVDSADVGSWQVGVLGQAPVSDYTSMYGNVTFALPGSGPGVVGSNELEWNLGVGLSYSLGGKAVNPSVSGQKGLPLLPVANNGSFLITN